MRMRTPRTAFFRFFSALAMYECTSLTVARANGGVRGVLGVERMGLAPILGPGVTCGSMSSIIEALGLLGGGRGEVAATEVIRPLHPGPLALCGGRMLAELLSTPWSR